MTQTLLWSPAHPASCPADVGTLELQGEEALLDLAPQITVHGPIISLGFLTW